MLYNRIQQYNSELCVLMNGEKKVGRPSEHRENILEKIIRDGKQSIPDLLNSFNVKRKKNLHPNSISREINNMENDELIDKKSIESHEHGKPTFYYDVTTEGIKKHINHKNVKTADNFLKIILKRNNKSNNLKTFLQKSNNNKQAINQIEILRDGSKIKLDEFQTNENRKYGFDFKQILYHYEKTVLGVDRNLWIPNFFQDYQNGKMSLASDLYNRSFLQRSDLRKQVINKIGSGKPLSLQQIIKFLNVEKIKNSNLELNYLLNPKNPKKSIVITKNITDEIQIMIMEMISKNILHPIRKNNQIVYELTYLGLIELFYDFFRDRDINFKTHSFNKKIEKIMKKHSLLLPEIFENYANLGIKPNQIWMLFVNLYYNSKLDYSYNSHQMRLNDIRKYLVNQTDSPFTLFETRKFFQESRQEKYHKKLSKHYSEIQSIILKNNHDIDLKFQDSDLEEMSMYSNCEALIKNRITMDFLYLYSLCFPCESKNFFEINSLLKEQINDYNSTLKLFIEQNIQMFALIH